jgi:hypothetical protein
VTPLDRDVLVAVCGGDDSTTNVSVGPVSYASTASDYRTCTDVVTRMTAEQPQYKDTRTWIGPFAFGTDTNAGPRAEATMRNIATVCGPPPR